MTTTTARTVCTDKDCPACNPFGVPASAWEPATRTTVVDCPSCAWTNFGGLGLGSFGRDYHDDLTEAAVELVRQPLIAAWRTRGYRVRLVEHSACAAIPASSEDPADETYQAVWREACDEVDSDALLAFTELAETYRDYLGEI